MKYFWLLRISVVTRYLFISAISILLLFSLSGHRIIQSVECDQSIVGTWYDIDDEGALRLISFHSDGNVELAYREKQFNPEYARSLGMEAAFHYSTDTAKSPHAIRIEIEIIRNGVRSTHAISGFYEMVNDTTLKIDIRTEEEEPIENFTSEAMLMRKNGNITDDEFLKKIEQRKKPPFILRGPNFDGTEHIDTIWSTDKDYEYLEQIQKDLEEHHKKQPKE